MRDYPTLYTNYVKKQHFYCCSTFHSNLPCIYHVMWGTFTLSNPLQTFFSIHLLETQIWHSLNTYQTLSIFDRNIKQSSVKLVFEASAQLKSEASKKKKKFDRVNGHQYNW